MYLISELKPRGAIAYRAPRRERPQEELPEPDSLRLMEKVYAQFDRKIGIKGYRTTLSNKADSSYEDLRAIGWATHRAERELLPEGYSPGKRPLLDGLAINLIDQVFNDELDSYLLSERFPKRHIFKGRQVENPISLDQLMQDLIDLSSWESKSPGAGSPAKTWEIGVSDRIAGWGKLTFLADIRVEHRETTIFAVSSPDDWLKRVVQGINGVLDDMVRRRGLARFYGDTKKAPALPADLRAMLKEELEGIGVPNGTYSREGFSSGYFPYPVTTSEIKDRRTTATHLIFLRCDCGAVKGVTLRGGFKRQKSTLTSFTKNQIVPWHDSFCGLLSGHRQRSAVAGLQPVGSKAVAMDPDPYMSFYEDVDDEIFLSDSIPY